MTARAHLLRGQSDHASQDIHVDVFFIGKQRESLSTNDVMARRLGKKVLPCSAFAYRATLSVAVGDAVRKSTSREMAATPWGTAIP